MKFDFVENNTFRNWNWNLYFWMLFDMEQLVELSKH